MRSSVHLRAPGYPRHPNDMELVNPFMHGYRLAEHVMNGLKAAGFEPSDPIGEDYGYCLLVSHPDHELRMTVHLCWMGDYPQEEEWYELNPEIPEEAAKLEVLAPPHTDCEFDINITPRRLTRSKMFFWTEDISEPIVSLRSALFGFIEGCEGLEIINWGHDEVGENEAA